MAQPWEHRLSLIELGHLLERTAGSDFNARDESDGCSGRSALRDVAGFTAPAGFDLLFRPSPQLNLQEKVGKLTRIDRQRIEEDLEAVGDNQGEQVAGALRDFKRLLKGF